ncbi:MAG: SUF system NifU family Fe-S cluster assembly protein [Cardiobacteriaceae bacterium]|nr:SUF system NifU family Fe-S cluster assembly protein [Cardiobacteriaceae bacterium]
MNSELENLYRDLIIDHSKNPRNFHSIADASHSATGHNPLCGDNLKIFIKLDGDKITDIAFVGDGCAISKASASLLTEIVKGKTVEEFLRIYDEFHEIATGEGEIPENYGKLKVLAGVRNYPARVKCATLAWHTVDAALKGQNSAKTE